MLPYYFSIPDLIAILCAVTGFCVWKYIPPSVRLLIVQAILSVIMDTSGYIMKVLHGKKANNHSLINILMVADFLLLLFSTYSVLPATIKRFLYPVTITIFMATWSYSVYYNGIGMFATVAIVTMSFLQTVNFLILLFCAEHIGTTIYRIPLRYLCLGLLLYHCCTTPMFLKLLNYIHIKRQPILDINALLDTIKYMMITASFILFRKYYRLQEKSMRREIAGT